MHQLLKNPAQRSADFDPDDLDEVDGLFVDLETDVSVPPLDVGHSPIVALICTKGGTGKTSLAVMLGGVLETSRRSVALVDLDPRRGAHRWSRIGNGLPFPVHTFDAQRGALEFRQSVAQWLSQADLLLIDTPPHGGEATRLALEVADLALVPAGASKLDLAAIEETLSDVESVRKRRGGGLPCVKVVPARQDGRTRLAREFAGRIKPLAVRLTPAVHQRVEIAAAADAGRLVRPSTVAGQEIHKLSRHVLSTLRRLCG